MPFSDQNSSTGPRQAGRNERSESLGSIGAEIAAADDVDQAEVLQVVRLEELSTANIGTENDVAVVLRSAPEIVPQFTSVIVKAASMRRSLPVLAPAPGDPRAKSPRTIDVSRFPGIVDNTFRRISPTERMESPYAADEAGGERAPSRVQFSDTATDELAEIGRHSAPSSARSSSLSLKSLIAKEVYNPRDPNVTFRGSHFMVNPITDAIIIAEHIREQIRLQGSDYLTHENFRLDVRLLKIAVDQIDPNEEIHAEFTRLLRDLEVYDPTYLQRYIAEIRAEAQARAEAQEEERRIAEARAEDESIRSEAESCWLPFKGCWSYDGLATTDEAAEPAPAARRSCTIM